MKAAFSALLMTVALAGCVPQQALIKETASGYPEGVFENTNVDATRSKLIEGCSSRGVLVQEASGNQVVCGKTMEGSDGVVTQMLIGNSYSTTPERKVRFIMYQVGADVRVTAQQWVESQMAYGQVRRQELSSNNQKNDIQQFLFSLGAR